MKNDKIFLTYNEQIVLLKSKQLKITNEQEAIAILKQYGYYSLISGYKDVFKVEKKGNYRSDASFEQIVSLYIFDDYLRHIFLQEIIHIEKHIKSLYSYSFCEMFGDKQSDYLNVTNYNYEKYPAEINKYVSKLYDTIQKPNKYPYISYNIKNYGSVPLWVIMQTLTFGNISKLYSFSNDKIKNKIAREFENVYDYHLSSMLNVISKFRNACAHGERLFSYKTKKSIRDLPIHSKLTNYSCVSKNDLFNVFICCKYLSTHDDFKALCVLVTQMIKTMEKDLGPYYSKKVYNLMGFPENWEDIILLDK